MSLVVFTELGFYCPQADVYIDPLRKVPKAIVTHAHSDHARPGMGHYLCESSGVEILKLRLGKGISVQGLVNLQFHENIYNKCGVEIEFIKGRLKFGDAKNSAPFPAMVVVFKPCPDPSIKYCRSGSVTTT